MITFESVETIITLTGETDVTEQREFYKMLEVFANSMLGILADKKPEIIQTLPDGRTWAMRLINEPSADTPILEVEMPTTLPIRFYFRPLTRENWPEFLTKITSEKIATKLHALIPELKDVVLLDKNSPFPEAVAAAENPILIYCYKWGPFDPVNGTLASIFDSYTHLKQASEQGSAS